MAAIPFCIRRRLGLSLPLLALAAVTLTVIFLGWVVDLDHAVRPKPNFRARSLPGFPDRIPFVDQAQIVEVGLWWLCLSVLLWVVGLFAIGLCAASVCSATRRSRVRRRRALAAMGLWLALTIAGLVYLTQVDKVPLMPVAPLVQILDLIAAGLVQLASLDSALAVVVGVALLAGTVLQLAPGAHRGEPLAQARSITLLMYAAAVFLTVWISATTGMYRLAASLLEAELRAPALKLAPTISLMGGLFLSLMLATVYLSATLWLQHRHRHGAQRSTTATVAAAADGEKPPSPAQFVAAHWAKMAAIVLPLLPGAAGTVLQALGKAA